MQVSAKRSRERSINTLRALRLQVEASAVRTLQLEQENAQLRTQLEILQKDIRSLQNSQALTVSYILER